MAMALASLSIFLLITISIQKAISTSCNTSTCIAESNRLLKQIDSNVNPCDDFYEFACGNYFRSDQEAFNYTEFYENVQKDIIGTYSEPIKSEEHVAAKMAKKLYQACMNTQAIEQDGLKTIKEVLGAIGGWPLVEGSNWDETKFDWVQATYKLRELGYAFDIFLSVLPNGGGLTIRIPFKVSEMFAVLSNRDHSIKNIAKAFGADINSIPEELESMYQFSEQMRQQMVEHRGLLSYPTYNVSEIQNKIEAINWVEFINKLIGPTLSVSPENSLTLVEERSIQKRLQIISETPKRLQANYMIWKLLEQMFPYLKSELRGYVLSKEDLNKPRGEFCLETVQKRFTPDPIYASFTKQHVSQSKKDFILQIVSDMKSEFLKHLEHVQWMTAIDKKAAGEKARNLVVVIGDAEGSSDQILDDSIVDILPTKQDNFLNLLAQAERNHVSSTYGKNNKPKKERIYEEWYMQPSYHEIVYSYHDNVLRIPTSNLLDEVFDTNKPKYSIYGTIARAVGVQMSFLLRLVTSYYDENANSVSGWSKETIAGFDNEVDCLMESLKKYKTLNYDFSLLEMQSNYFAVKISYGAYKRWVKTIGEEQKLPNLDYTPNQLFWISTVTCRRETLSGKDAVVFGVDLTNFTRVSTYATVRDNSDFGKDFNCPNDTPMNPSDRCHLI